ncbi:dephospho-CoA kinase [Aestuariivivens sediminicola]|uniref:dephospho-CoA kinase n=1 Tax=Aestuariivivens sediminicola TaxID=2913560 RepID=UPI001F561994|nr:dephospho-CoA kinase [Aestuariivivens sediminicola]
MIIVGLTGGIGSGKSTVANAFNALGIPVYIADEEAKRLMNKSQVIKRELIGLIGEGAYTKEGLNRSFIANIIFKDKSLLNKINDIVHPEVAKHFKKWVKAQNGPYVVKEAAILFENNGYKACDYVITVTAPKDVKMQRLLSRDKTSIERIEAIMQNQWHDEDRIPLSDFVIENTDLENTKKQVLNIHNKILERIR